MITVLRNNLKDGGMITIIWIAVASMIIGSALPLVMKKKADSWALKINGTEIAYTTYAAELAIARDYITMLRSQYGQFADYLLQNMGIADPQSMTIQQLVSNQLMIDGYMQQGIKISPESIAHKINYKSFIDAHCTDLLPPFLYKNGIIDNVMLKMYLQRRGMTVEQLEQHLQERVGTVFMREALRTIAYVPKAEMDAASQKDQRVKDILVIKLSIDQFKKEVLQNSNPTLDDLKSFYTQENAHARRYYVPEKRSGFTIQFKPDSYGITIDNHAIERYYQEHKTNRYIDEPSTMQVRVAAFSSKQEAENARLAMLNHEKEMATIAQEYVFNEYTKIHGGLLEKPIIRGTGDRIIEKASFALIHDGDISSVVEHNKRFIIIQRVHKTDPVIKPLAKVRNDIEKLLLSTQFKEICSRDLNNLLQTPIENDITEFTKSHKGVRTPVSLAQYDAKTEVEKALFALESGSYSVVTQGDSCYIIHLDSITPTALQLFESIEDQVKNDFITYKADLAIKQATTTFLQKTKGQDAYNVARELGYVVTRYNNIQGSTGGDNIAPLRKEGIDIGILNRLEKAGTYATVKRDDGIILVFLEKITINQEISTESAKKAFVAAVLKQEVDTIGSAYIASLYRDAKIEKNNILALLDEENAI